MGAETLARTLARGMMGLLLFAATVELAVRVLRPTPRLLVVTPTRVGDGRGQAFEVVDGQPLWRDLGSDARRDPACDPAWPEVWLLGTSVTFGIGLAPEATMGPHLQADLAARGAQACVRNFAQPGYGAAARIVEARRELAAGRRPAIVVWESWENDPVVLTPIDGTAYALSDVATDAGGWPAPPLPVPLAMHHLLFGRSRAWWYTTLALVRFDEQASAASWRVYLDERLPRFVDEVEAVGAHIIVAIVPRLDRPFEATGRASWIDGDLQLAVVERAEALGLEVVVVADRLAGRPVEPLRQDLCCHVTAEGARAYAEAVLPEVARALASRGPEVGARDTEAASTTVESP